MSRAPRSLIKSRQTLQAIIKNHNELRKYELFDRILDIVWYDIVKPQVAKTKHIIGFINYNSSWTNINNIMSQYQITDSFKAELIEILKKEYPGCNITYNETKDEDGNLDEQYIIIDWS